MGAGGGAVGDPQLVAMLRAVIGGAEQRLAVAERGDVLGVGPGRSGVDVQDHLGAGGGAVGDPQLAAVAAVVGREQRRAVAERGGVLGVGPGRSGVDVQDHLGAGAGAVGDPQLPAMRAVKGAEQRRAVAERGYGRGRDDVIDQIGAVGGAIGDPQIVANKSLGREQRRAVAERGDVVGGGSTRSGVDVPDHLGAGGGAVADPQLATMCAVIGAEQRRAVAERGDLRVEAGSTGVGAARSGVDVVDQMGAGGGAVGDPQLIAVAAVIGAEKNLCCHDSPLHIRGTKRRLRAAAIFSLPREEPRGS